MALAARSKPTAYHRKRAAQHHRHSKTYLKTYWPYLPLFAILSGGAALNRFWSIPAGGLNPASVSSNASRVQVLTGSSEAWLTTATLLVAAIALGIFLLRHSLQLQRVLVRGEDYVSHHPFPDIAIALIFTAGFVLSGSSGPLR